MRFTVEQNGTVKMWTEEASCIPDRETLLLLKAAGYKLKLNGKPYKVPTKLTEK